jgi:ribosomal protein L11 methyltransferase
MFKISTTVDNELAFRLEEFFSEMGSINWGIDKPNDDDAPVQPELFGYFEDAQQAEEAYAELLVSFPELPDRYSHEKVNACDWQNEYKKYLKPWSVKNLHWVPVWDKGNYEVPARGKVFYFDAGMAFGTGDHPTTRLCAIRMLDYIAKNGDVSGKFLIDAGCGSGILALSAKLLGFGKVYGFDFDPEAVRASLENAGFNNVPLDNTVFEEAGITEGLAGKSCDIMLANIQADVLMKYASDLVAGVKDGGTLVLSGILAYENDEVKKCFETIGGDRIKNIESSIMGEWSDLLIEFN